MTESADVVVIGCGVAGAWTALFLARAGMRRVVVVEREHPGAGASTRGTGLLRVHYVNRAEMRLAWLGHGYYRGWSEHVGIGSAGWRHTGLLWLVGPEDVQRLERNLPDQLALGARAEILRPDAIAELQPHLDLTGIGAALHEPDAGTTIGRLAIDGLVSALLLEGVQVRTHTPVRRIVRHGDRVVGVETPTGLIATERVVLAAGAWSGRLAATAGVMLPLTPTRATLGTAYYPPRLDTAMALFDNTLDFAFAPKAGGSWAIVPVRDAGFLEPVDPDRPLRMPARRAAEAGLRLVRRRIPQMRDAVQGERWAAIDGCTPDRRPILGAHPELVGLYIHTGGNFKGFKVAPAASRALAEEIVAGPTVDSVIAPFSAARFSRPMEPEDVERQYTGARWT